MRHQNLRRLLRQQIRPRLNRPQRNKLKTAYLRSAEVWLFLAAILDAWNRRLVGRSGLRADCAAQEELVAPLAFKSGEICPARMAHYIGKMYRG